MENNKTTKEIILNIVDNFERLTSEGKEAFKKFLIESDYFNAPFTTEYAYSYDGGLAQYGLDTLNTIYVLLNNKIFDKVRYLKDTLEIICLFHALGKVNYFDKYIKSEKVYTPNGSKYDDFGNFDWVSKQCYKVKPANLRYTVGEMGFTSFMVLSKFVPLTDEEVLAITHYNCGMDNGHSTRDIFEILNSNPLVALLHCASMLNLNCITHLHSEVK